jgi:hypothetical protein
MWMTREISDGNDKTFSIDGCPETPGNGWSPAKKKFSATGGMREMRKGDERRDEQHKPVASSASLKACEPASQLFA